MRTSRVEKLLFDYFPNLGKMEGLQRAIARLMSVHGAQIEPNVGDAIIDPVARRMDEVEKLERELEALKAVTIPVTRLVNDLPDELLFILDQRYFKRKSWKALRKKKGWSKATMWRRKKELVRIAGEYLSAAFL